MYLIIYTYTFNIIRHVVVIIIINLLEFRCDKGARRKEKKSRSRKNHTARVSTVSDHANRGQEMKRKGNRRGKMQVFIPLYRHYSETRFKSCGGRRFRENMRERVYTPVSARACRNRTRKRSANNKSRV